MSKRGVSSSDMANLAKFGLSEDRIVNILQEQFAKFAQDKEEISICVYGGTEAARQALLGMVFDADYAEASCILVETGGDVPPCNLVWVIGDAKGEFCFPYFRLPVVSAQTAAECVQWSVSALHGKARDTFIRHQKVDISLNERMALKAVAKHCALAFGLGFVPLPVKSSTLLVTNELAVFARVLLAYDISDAEQAIRTIGLDALIGGILTLLGRTVANKLLKAVRKLPKWLSILLGGVISGSVATAVTLAFGVSVSKVMRKLLSGEMTLANSGETAAMITGTAIKCLEEGRETAADYECFDPQTKDLIDNMAKGKRFFDEFVAENKRLDDEFAAEHNKGQELSRGMWGAISRL